MKSNTILTITSVLSILFMTFHVTDDVQQNQGEVSGVGILSAALILVVWLYASLLLAEGRWRYVIILIGSFLAAFVAAAHMLGAGDIAVGAIAKSSGPFFAWAVIALGVTAVFTVILSARLLLTSQKIKAR